MGQLVPPGRFGAGGDRIAEVGFEHEHHRLDLSALPVGLVVEILEHAPTKPAPRPIGGPAYLGGHQRVDLEALPQHLVVVFAVVVRVGYQPSGQRVEAHAFEGGVELVDIGPRSVPAVVGLEEGLEHQAGKELRLGEGVGPAAADVGRGCPFPDEEGRRRHPPG